MEGKARHALLTETPGRGEHSCHQLPRVSGGALPFSQTRKWTFSRVLSSAEAQDCTACDWRSGRGRDSSHLTLACSQTQEKELGRLTDSTSTDLF